MYIIITRLCNFNAFITQLRIVKSRDMTDMSSDLKLSHLKIKFFDGKT